MAAGYAGRGSREARAALGYEETRKVSLGEQALQQVGDVKMRSPLAQVG